MAENINLLPTSLAPDVSTVKSASALKRLVVWGLILFIFLGVLCLAFFIFLTTQTNQSLARQEQIKKSIKAMQETEQRLVLVKDRIGKAVFVQAKDNAYPEIRNFELLYGLLPEKAELKKTEIKPRKMSLAFTTDDSAVFAEYMASVVGSGYYSKIVLATFTFNQDNGFNIVFDLER